MLFEEKEANLLDDLRLIFPQEIFLVNDNTEILEVFNSIYDESSAYFEAERETNVFSNKGEAGTPHAWFFDKAFLDVFIGSDIDYFVWLTPYKHFQHIEPPVSLPKVCVYRCNSITYELIEYKPSHMVSSEE